MGIDVELAVSSEPDAVPRARRWLAEQVEAPAAMLEDAQLVLSELLSNALLHGLAPIVAWFRPTGDGLRVEVSDGSRRSLVIPVRSREAMTGRGLALVAALSDSWGVEVPADGNDSLHLHDPNNPACLKSFRHAVSSLTRHCTRRRITRRTSSGMKNGPDNL